MSHQNNTSPTAKEMIRAHTVPVLAGFSSLTLLAIAILLVPQAVKSHRYNRCVDVQVNLRSAVNPQGGSLPGKLNYLKAIQHCEGL